jgi:hypothetical protein
MTEPTALAHCRGDASIGRDVGHPQQELVPDDARHRAALFLPGA